MATIKYSRQRESIKNYLAHTKEHPTADMIYMKIRESFPNISLGTVYRNLNLLAEQGEIRKLSCGDGCDHFDGDISPHYHFVCNHCNCVMDLNMPSLDHIDTLASANFAGKITNHSVLFSGLCPDCLAKEKLS
ncbi:MAG: transcriptional repressor [Lachnospiraceae bacterium]|nr:transcriptional repressor [Lachnospiraceae bacterium]